MRFSIRRKSSADRFEHHVRGAHGGHGQNGAVEQRDRANTVGPAPHRDFCEVESMWRVAQIVESRADAYRSAAIRDPRATILSSCWSDATCAMPTCRSGSSRHAESTSRLRSFDSTSAGGSLPTAAASAAMTA